MKKPSAYLPFYGNDFFQSLAGYTDTVAIRYLRAIWHYWSHTGCTGLPDDDDYLRRICDCQAAEWAAIKAIIVSDNDKPGLDGARKVGGELKLPYAVYVPPAKDLREFVRLGGTRAMIENTLKGTVWNR